MDPLEALFSSRVRVSLLRVLLADPERELHGRELARRAGERQSAVWRELQHLESIGLVQRQDREGLTYFRVHAGFPLLSGLRILFAGAAAPAAEATKGRTPAALPAQPRLRRAQIVIGEND